MPAPLRALLREPLLHFLVLGALLFAAYGLLDRGGESRPDEVVISAGQVEHLAGRFARLQQRSPSPEELKGLVDQVVREEILAREAAKLGLDRNDAVIRQRLQQKMEFVANDLASLDEPTEADLAAWYASHANDFRRDVRLSFRHVYLRPDRRGERLQGDAASLLAELRSAGASADIQALGDSLLVPRELAEQPLPAIAAQFGPEFATELGKLAVGAWAGPIRSGYGVHLVVVTARDEGRLPPLGEVRELVRRELMNARRLEANRRFMEELLARYKVTVEWPQATPAKAVAERGR